MVPTFVEEVIVCNSVSRQAGEHLVVHTDLQLVAQRSIKARITANIMPADCDRAELPSIETNGLVCTAIPGGFPPAGEANGVLGKCHRLRWIPLGNAETPLGPGSIAAANAIGEGSPQISLVQPSELAPISRTSYRVCLPYWVQV